jgi:long-chain acyl-CoA synthetase
MTTAGPRSAVIAEDGEKAWLRSYPEGVDWAHSIPPQPVYCLLDEAAARFGDRPATNFLGRTITYKDLDRRVKHTAAGLAKLGVRHGTKVGLFLPNCPIFIVYYYAVLNLGGVVVNYNPLYTIEELAFQVRDSDTKLMVTLDLKLLFDKVERLIADGVLDRAVVASFPALLPSAKAVLFRAFRRRELAAPARSPVAANLVSDADVSNGSEAFERPPIDPVKDIAVLQYTGGTTGTPKGAMLTHSNLYVNALQVAAWAPNLVPGQEKMLAVLPFFHVFAMTVVMNFSIARAAEMLIMPRFMLDDAMKLIDRAKPTCMPGVPTLFNAIMNHAKLKNFDMSSLKFCLSGGAPLPLEVKNRFEALTGCKLVEGYGLSEASPVVTCNPLEGPVKPGSIGLPLPLTEISLRDISQPAREVPQGEKGEICIRGPQVMAGYYKRPEETAGQLVDGWLRTGDVARMDDDGFYFIEDRIKDLIISSGYNVYPRRIEEAIYTHPSVAEVTVIGIKDPYRGEAPKAFVKLKPGATLTTAELMRHLEVKISKLELPAAIEFRDELPKTMIGKLSKKELKAEEADRAKSA